MEVMFGSGTLVGVRTDVTSPTPVQFGVLQDVQTDFDFTMKELMGQYQAPVAVARAGLKIQITAKEAQIYAGIYRDLFFNETSTTGILAFALNEAGTVPATPFQITVTNGATFVHDEGVKYSLTGIPLTRVASTPTTGQYTVDETTGKYTFSTGDTGVAMLISYTYTSPTGGIKTVITNQLMGSAPQFRMTLATTYQSKIFNLELNACVASKLSFPFKNEDFVISNFQAQAFADASGNIGTISSTE